jgi:membrane protein YdbS with pleckstrin-like domain
VTRMAPSNGKQRQLRPAKFAAAAEEGVLAGSARGLAADERVVASTRKHGKELTGPVLVLLVTCWVAGFLLAAALSKLGALGGQILLVVAALVVLWFVLRPFLSWLSTTYTVTNRRILLRSGVLRRHGRDVWLQAVSDVWYERSLLDRLVGSGTLVVADASGFRRAVLHDVPAVRSLQMIIADLVRADMERRPPVVAPGAPVRR